MRINSYDLPNKPFLSWAYTQEVQADGTQKLRFKGHTSMEAARRSAEKLRRSIVDEAPNALQCWGYQGIETSDHMFGVVL